ncbi:MAG: hypothetical protein WD557_10305 [Dehalococcoidia bacterium]
MAFVTGTGLVSAAATIHVWPPYGWSQQGGFPYANFGFVCVHNGEPWVHSVTSHVFDGGEVTGLYVQYYDVYDGIADSDVDWNWQEIFTSHDYRDAFPPWPGKLFEDDWTAWYEDWFEYDIGTEDVVARTYFGHPLSGGCQSSILVYRHY